MRIIASGIEKYDPNSYDKVAIYNMTAPSHFISKIELFCAAITLSAATMQNLLKCICKSLYFLSFPLIECKAFDLLKHTIHERPPRHSFITSVCSSSAGAHGNQDLPVLHNLDGNSQFKSKSSKATAIWHWANLYAMFPPTVSSNVLLLFPALINIIFFFAP